MRAVLGAAGVASAAATAGWFVLAKVQGDSEMGFGRSNSPCAPSPADRLDR